MKAILVYVALYQSCLASLRNDLVSKPDDCEVIETFKHKLIVGLRSRFKMPDDPLFAQSAVTVSLLFDPRHKILQLLMTLR